MLIRCSCVGTATIPAKMSSSGSQTTKRTWELTLYELKRTLQELMTANTETAVSPRCLQSDLRCPICLDTLKNTMTAMEQTLRPDPNFDLLIAKMYPSRDEYEAHQERVMANANRQHSQTLAHSYPRPDTEERPVPRARPAPCRLPWPRPEQAYQDPPPEVCAATESAGGETEETDADDAALNSEIELVLKSLPQMIMEGSSTQVRHIKTPANARVAHLSKYQAMRVTLDKLEQDASAPRSVAPFAIFVAFTPGQFTPLPGSMTRDKVKDKY
ncbi:hypothetical protein HPB48_019587 [Haemaphysalis longicornis]|uniref:RING-type E3 ubiquitin transferase n=1 Tax=Haemaphysalis longicornis TaxID=44386 RepID=A0A9J6FF15_HAELO|nr:hypothetical protein HPB48_019587 [Haemaphysalis longicornis]